MATNLDSVYLRAAGSPPRQADAAAHIPLTSAWTQPQGQAPGIADRCRAAMFGIYLRCKGIPEKTARWIFQNHSGHAASWRRVVAHDELQEAFTAPRPGLADRCRAAMFGLYLRSKGMDDDMARAIFDGRLERRHPCVKAWFKVHGRGRGDDFPLGRMAPALRKMAETWVQPYAWAQPVREEVIRKAMASTLRRVIEPTGQARREAVGLERFAAETLREALRAEHGALTRAAWDLAGGPVNEGFDPKFPDGSGFQRFTKTTTEEVLAAKPNALWRERFIHACTVTAWNDPAIRAHMGLQADQELSSEQQALRAEIASRARQASLRAGVSLARDPEDLAVQLVTGEVGIHPAFRTIPPKSNVAGVEGESTPVRKRTRGGASGGLGTLGGSEANPWPNPGAPDGRRIKGRQPPAIARVREAVASPAGEPAGE